MKRSEALTRKLARLDELKIKPRDRKAIEQEIAELKAVGR